MIRHHIILLVIITLLLIPFLPLVVDGTASLVANGIYSFGKSVTSLLHQLSLPGKARLEAVIRICLYLIAVTFLVKVLMRKW